MHLSHPNHITQDTGHRHRTRERPRHAPRRAPHPPAVGRVVRVVQLDLPPGPAAAPDFLVRNPSSQATTVPRILPTLRRTYSTVRPSTWNHLQPLRQTSPPTAPFLPVIDHLCSSPLRRRRCARRSRLFALPLWRTRHCFLPVPHRLAILERRRVDWHRWRERRRWHRRARRPRRQHGRRIPRRRQRRCRRH